jgi:hypothetical protein
MNPSPLRFFFVVGLHPPYAIAALAAVMLAGLWILFTSPTELDSALGMLLVVQMFLASTGFVVRARRGHFDPILIAASSRARVLIAHWLFSIAPGLAGWVVLSATAGALGNAQVWSTFAGHRLLALLIVSSVSWTVGFGLPRSAAGALWMAGLIAALVSHADLIGSREMASTAPWMIVRHAGAVIFCPFLLLGSRPPLAAESMLGAASVMFAATGARWLSVERLDLYLMDRS